MRRSTSGGPGDSQTQREPAGDRRLTKRTIHDPVRLFAIRRGDGLAHQRPRIAGGDLDVHGRCFSRPLETALGHEPALAQGDLEDRKKPGQRRGAELSQVSCAFGQSDGGLRGEGVAAGSSTPGHGCVDQAMRRESRDGPLGDKDRSHVDAAFAQRVEYLAVMVA